jgi:hypothetical protein
MQSLIPRSKMRWQSSSHCKIDGSFYSPQWDYPAAGTSHDNQLRGQQTLFGSRSDGRLSGEGATVWDRLSRSEELFSGPGTSGAFNCPLDGRPLSVRNAAVVSMSEARSAGKRHAMAETAAGRRVPATSVIAWEELFSTPPGEKCVPDQ